MLAQSSDWLFIITNGTMVDYAKKRIKDHIGRFNKLYYQIKNDEIDEDFLKDISKKDCVFPDIDYKIWDWEGLRDVLSIPLFRGLRDSPLIFFEFETCPRILIFSPFYLFCIL